MADAPAPLIEVEVVYALAHEQFAQTLRVVQGTNVGQAIEQSGVLARYPEIASHALAVGIYGRRVAPATVLQAHDRVEIYRPLIADPKRARRTRAQRQGNARR